MLFKKKVVNACHRHRQKEHEWQCFFFCSASVVAEYAIQYQCWRREFPLLLFYIENMQISSTTAAVDRTNEKKKKVSKPFLYYFIFAFGSILYLDRIVICLVFCCCCFFFLPAPRLEIRLLLLHLCNNNAFFFAATFGIKLFARTLNVSRDLCSSTKFIGRFNCKFANKHLHIVQILHCGMRSADESRYVSCQSHHFWCRVNLLARNVLLYCYMYKYIKYA